MDRRCGVAVSCWCGRVGAGLFRWWWCGGIVICLRLCFIVQVSEGGATIVSATTSASALSVQASVSNTTPFVGVVLEAKTSNTVAGIGFYLFKVGELCVFGRPAGGGCGCCC